MSKVTHTASDFSVETKKEKVNSIYHFFYGWDADGAPVEEYPTKIVNIKIDKKSK